VYSFAAHQAPESGAEVTVEEEPENEDEQENAAE
jgi:hypothetical protein